MLKNNKNLFPKRLLKIDCSKSPVSNLFQDFGIGDFLLFNKFI